VRRERGGVKGLRRRRGRKEGDRPAEGDVKTKGEKKRGKGSREEMGQK